MKAQMKTIGLTVDLYNILKSQAVAADRTLTGQIKYLLKLNEDADKQDK